MPLDTDFYFESSDIVLYRGKRLLKLTCYKGPFLFDHRCLLTIQPYYKKKTFLISGLILLQSTMARQLMAKEVLIYGDSNVQRHLLHSGKYYFQQSDCEVSRNVHEFTSALQTLPQEKYKLVVFAMLTNIVIDAGQSAPGNLFTRLGNIENCVKALVKTIR
jgi:hypothetical protein